MATKRRLKSDIWFMIYDIGEMIPSLLKPEPCLAAPWISLRQYYLVFKARLYNEVAHSRCAPMYRKWF